MLSFFVATIGYEGARFNRREASVVCIVLTGFVSLATLVFVIITFTADFSRDLSERAYRLPLPQPLLLTLCASCPALRLRVTGWGLATPLVRRDIESSYDCCGFADIEDRPAYPCDTKARSACAAAASRGRTTPCARGAYSLPLSASLSPAGCKEPLESSISFHMILLVRGQ